MADFYNYSLWVGVQSFKIGNVVGFQGNSFSVPAMPDSEYISIPKIPQSQTMNPYGFLGFPKKGTPQYLLNNISIGYLDNRIVEGLSDLIAGECAIFSDSYSLCVKMGGVEVYREDGFKTHATSAENTQAILRSIFLYLKTVSSQLNALSNSFKTHTHTVPNIQGGNDTATSNAANTASASPPIDYFTSQSSSYPVLLKGDAYNEQSQTYIQDGTNLIKDI